MISLEKPESGCWISAVHPTAAEIGYLTEELHIERDFVSAALDEEESSRIENEEDQTLVIVDYPVAEQQTDENQTILYTTMPMGIIITPQYVITVCLKENLVVNEMVEGRVKGLQTPLKTRFLLMTLLRIAMRSFFSNSLKSNEITLEKILRGRIIKLYEEDEDLLEDVLIEIKQAIEMCNIYSNILSGTMDAFASVVSNNLNIVMKVLTCITIVMAIPTMIFSFYGMNIQDMPIPYAWFPLALSGILSGVVALVFFKKDMFH